MNKYQPRWENAKAQALAIKSKCREIGEGYLLHFEGCGFINEDQLKITISDIAVVDGDCTYKIFTNNLDLDQGLYDEIEITNQMFQRDFHIMMEVCWDVK